MFRSANRLSPCGAIFDAPAKQRQLSVLEKQINEPNFWNDPEKSQKAMRGRKRIEEAIESDQKIGALTSDLDTLFELAREGERMEDEIATALKPYSELLEKLETEMLE
jgi:peptide chain release factor 2